MAKRKRGTADAAAGLPKALRAKKDAAAPAPKQAAKKEAEQDKKPVASKTKTTIDAAPSSKDTGLEDAPVTFQIITGSYERVLHGFAASIPRKAVADASTAETEKPKIDFTDTFLFNAHASAIRCLALSPLSDETPKVTLASGATDERINLYSISTAPPVVSKTNPKLPTLSGNSITENPKNKELGSLQHHSSNITALYFPTRAKLLSAAEDSTIAITRTRDWTALSTIKAPIPKPQGRPSGDTAGPGEVPSGINDFSVHPSMKLMVSVGKGEKCMRLWNLVTGKKAGVLNFGRDMLASVGEGRFQSGEGRRVIWDKEGEEFAVGFERGVVVFGIDSKPKAQIVPTPKTKIHQMHYLPSESHPSMLLVSTEDGRILVYDTTSTTTTEKSEKTAKTKEEIPTAELVAQIGGPAAGITGRIKDFEVLPAPGADKSAFIVIAGSSDGTVRLWLINTSEFKDDAEEEKGSGFTASQVGKLLGTYSTGTRITCLKAFEMTGKADEEEEVVDKSEMLSDSDSDSE